MKILPKADFKTTEEAFVTMEKIRSCCHATKPIDKENFDGKIFLKQVSELIPSGHVSFNQHFPLSMKLIIPSRLESGKNSFWILIS